MVEKMEDLVNYICIGATKHEVELSQLRDEKCCYTYLDGGETKQFTGKIKSVRIASEFDLAHEVKVKGLTNSLFFDDCEIYQSGSGGLGIFVKNLINVE